LAAKKHNFLLKFKVQRRKGEEEKWRRGEVEKKEKKGSCVGAGAL